MANEVFEKRILRSPLEPKIKNWLWLRTVNGHPVLSEYMNGEWASIIGDISTYDIEDKAARDALSDMFGSVSYDSVSHKLNFYSSYGTTRLLGSVDVTQFDVSGGYEPPVGGIPKNDLASDVRDSLSKADTALQVQQQSDWSEDDDDAPGFIKNKPDISNLATKTELNSKQDVINDLAAIRSGAAAGATAAQPSDIPNDLGDLTNNAGYTKNLGTITGITMNGASKGTSGVVDLGTVITAHQDISGKANTADLATVATSGSYADLSNKPTIPTVDTTLASGSTNAAQSGAVYTALAGKQATLVSGTNIKTVNNESILGSGNLTITGEKGDKGDTGNVTLTDGDLDSLTIYNGLDYATNDSDAVLTAYQGYVLGCRSIGIGTYGQAWKRSQLHPSVFPWIWNETISGDSIVKPIFHIGNGNFIDAVGAEITLEGTAADTPTFSQSSGTVEGGTVITITPSTGELLYVKVGSGSPIVTESAQSVTINQASVTVEAWCATYGGESTHVTNTYTAAAPNTPTFSPSTDGDVSRSTSLTVTPASGCQLYYQINGGAWQNTNADVAFTATILATGYSYSIKAKSYNANTQMYSEEVSKTYTIARPASPTMTDNASAVERGGSITINRNNESGTIHYTVNGGTEQTSSSSSVSVTLPTQSTTVAAWVEDSNNEVSETVTKQYTMAALASPTFSPAAGEVVEGASVSISAASGTTIYYTTDGSTPTSSSTQYSSAITLNTATTIKAIAVDQYGSSAVAESAYTIKEDAIIIDTTDATASVTLGYKDTSDVSQTVTFNLDSAVDSPVGSGKRNTIVINSTNFPDLNTSKQFSSISFSDKTKVKRIYGGGAIIPAGSQTYNGASALVYFEGNNGASAASMYRTFYSTPSGAVFKVSGTADTFQEPFRCSNINGSQVIDITGLVPYNSNGFSNCNTIVYNQKGSTLKINGSFKIASNATKKDVVYGTNGVTVKNLEIHSDTPPDLTVDWFAGLVAQASAQNTTISLKVPAGKIDTYKAASGWSTYANHANVEWGEIS